MIFKYGSNAQSPGMTKDVSEWLGVESNGFW